jgi:pyruvate/2-oxoglutarate dehydrogenase complex dihydrolipoamide acyltransferase (E2) component
MVEIKMPEAGFSITEGTVIKWYKSIGDRVSEGENVVCVETEKITVDIPAERSGVLQEMRYKEGEIAPVGSVMGTIAESCEKITRITEKVLPAEEKAAPPQIKRTEESLPDREKKISPAAKAIARSKKVNLSEISVGTGPLGRIVKQDVLDYITKGNAGQTVAESGVTGTTARDVNRRKVEEKGKRVEFKGWRKVIAERMLASWREIPHYTMSIEADVTELWRTIGRIREKEKGLHITYLPFMMKSMALGIEEIPQINAHCDKEGFTILQEVNINVAVESGERLLIPVVRDVGKKSILELVRDLDGLVQKAGEDKLGPEDISGGTVTLTNVGMFGTHSATSIIFPPQVAIMYMGAARDVPAVWEGRIEVRKKMIFGVTYDHRVINGATGGRFLMRVKECLEDLCLFMMRLDESGLSR